MPPSLPDLIRAMIAAEKAKAKALYAHASNPTNGSLETLVEASVAYDRAMRAVEAALAGDDAP